MKISEVQKCKIRDEFINLTLSTDETFLELFSVHFSVLEQSFLGKVNNSEGYLSYTLNQGQNGGHLTFTWRYDFNAKKFHPKNYLERQESKKTNRIFFQGKMG